MAVLAVEEGGGTDQIPATEKKIVFFIIVIPQCGACTHERLMGRFLWTLTGYHPPFPR
jgi:hypothetical protein